MDLREAREWIKYTYETLGVPELIGVTEIEFSNRMTSTMGTALYKPCGWNKMGQRSSIGTGEIKLSRKLFDRASEKDQYETVIHEACHIVDRYLKNPSDRKTQGHGPSWVALMEKCGITPERFHCVPTKGLRKKTRVIVKCKGCEKIYKISKTLYSRRTNESGSIGRCTQCKCDVRYVSEIQE